MKLSYEGKENDVKADGDEDDDIDWEAEEGEREVLSSDLQDVIQVTLSSSTNTNTTNAPPASTKKIPKPRKKISEESYRTSFSKCCQQLCRQLERVCAVLRWSREESIQAISMSLLSSDLLDLSVSREELCGRLFAWMRSTFQIISSRDVTDEEGRDGSSSEELEARVLCRKAGSSVQVTQIFLAVLSALDVRHRLVVLLSTRLLNPLSTENYEDSLRVWVEVEVPATTTVDWLPVDFESLTIGLSQLTKKTFLKNSSSSLAISVEVNDSRGLSCVDLTPKYLSRPRFSSRRMGESFEQLKTWLSQKLNSIALAGRIGVSDQTGIIDLVESDNEQERLQAMEVGRLSTIPTALGDFRHHPTYVLERYLHADEMICPDERQVVAIVRGEPVFRRDSVSKLRTKQQWRQRLRIVQPDQQPIKTRRHRKRKSGDEQNYTDMEVVELPLYGEWQTAPWEIPPVVDGILPRNQFGNWEVWGGQQRFVPLGAIFVASEYAVKAAKMIGIQFVPAVISFESRSGRSHPVIGGVVVLLDHESILRDCIFTIEGLRSEEAYLSRERMIAGKWLRLARSLLVRQGLNEKYDS
eukprot:scaffold2312_cov165-Ochromonas_danica.AAC.29